MRTKALASCRDETGSERYTAAAPSGCLGGCLLPYLTARSATRARQVFGDHMPRIARSSRPRHFTGCPCHKQRSRLQEG
jgi:hypothetical protein